MSLDNGLLARSTSLADLMKFDPGFGTPEPYPSHPAHYRGYHGARAWLFNPYSGERRHPCDVGTDPFGLLCVDHSTLNWGQSCPVVGCRERMPHEHVSSGPHSSLNGDGSQC